MTVEGIQRIVAQHFDMTVAKLCCPRRYASIAKPRMIAMYLVRKRLKTSYPLIGFAFNRDHSTVISACRRIEELLSRNNGVSDNVRRIEARLNTIDSEITSG